MTRLLGLVLFVALGWLAFPSVAQAQGFQQALTFCQQQGGFPPGTPPHSCVPVQTSPTAGYIQLQWCDIRQNPCTKHNADSDKRYFYTGAIPNGFGCPAGQTVPNGTPYKQSSATGQACRSSDMCEMALKVGGADSGTLVLTGATCEGGTFGSGLSGDPAPPGKPPPQTANPDGSTTYCDSISGSCVTAAPGAGAPPPPVPGADAPDGSANPDNSSTNTGSKTDNSGGTSTTTSTSTTTTSGTTTSSGGGDGGTGTGPGTGTYQGGSTTASSSSTSTPATASSTSSKCTGGACDVGQADGNVGGLYQPTSDTVNGIYSDFRTAVAASPLVGAATGFFNASGISGSCPTWQIPGNRYWGEAGFSFDFFCSPGMLALLLLAGYLVLAVGAFSAFRIALY